MYKRSKLLILEVTAVTWFFATILLILYILSNTDHDALVDERDFEKSITRQSKSRNRNSKSSLPQPTVNYDVISYEKYSIGQKKLHRLDVMLKKIMSIHPRVEDDYYSFNVTRSDELSVTRDVPDHRPGECINRKFNYSSFPTVSVVTPLHNEALTTLVRHVHAILARTPPLLLLDVILVDDNSTFDYLGNDLEEYFRILDPRIKVIRNKERKGLIRSRLLGADLSQGEVIIFLDAHMEVCEGWIEPLLERINSHSDIVVQPDIVGIDGNTFSLYTGNTVAFRGGFGWDMRYSWFRLPDYLHQLPRTDWGPVPFPVLQGSCIAIRKSYFNSIGRFDPGLEIWGGEHFELSFNVWMTGGRVECLPCSKVGHIFKSNKYSFGSGKKNTIVAKNDLRVAEVWTDEYKKIIRAAVKGWEDPLPVLSESDWKSIEERRSLRNRRQSKSFDWFLKNVMPEQRIPTDTDIFYGEIRNLKTNQCFYVMEDGYIGMSTKCDSFIINPEDTFALDVFGRVKHDTKCLWNDEATRLLKVQDCPCTSTDRTWPYWSLDGAHLVFSGSFGKLCATQANSQFEIHRGLEVVQLQVCDGNIREQDWGFMYLLKHN